MNALGMLYENIRAIPIFGWQFLHSYLKCSSGRDVLLCKQAWRDCRSLINTSYVKINFKLNLKCASKSLLLAYIFFNERHMKIIKLHSIPF